MDYYFAVFMPAEEGGYVVQFPDFPEAFSEADDFARAMRSAQKVLRTAVDEYTNARKDLPKSTGLAGAQAWLEAHRADEGVGRGEFHIQAFKAPSTDMTPVRISVSFAKSVLDEIDDKAERLGENRSSFLAKAAHAYVTE